MKKHPQCNGNTSEKVQAWIERKQRNIKNCGSFYLPVERPNLKMAVRYSRVVEIFIVVH